MPSPAHKVLVVDDNLGMWVGLRAALNCEGCFEAVGPARTLAEALTLASAADAAVLDLTLPDSCGVDTARRFRDTHPKLPVVLYSGLLLGDDADRYVNARVDKGRVDELLQTLRRVCASPDDGCVACGPPGR